MTAPANDALRLDAATHVTWTELVIASGWPESEVRELVRYGAVAPRDPAAATWTFEAHSLELVRRARRLRRDFELDPHGVSVVLCYAERIDALEAELRAVRAVLG
jgi:hypothetical protein